MAGNVEVVGVTLGGGEVAQWCGAKVLLGYGLRRLGFIREVLAGEVFAQASSRPAHHAALTTLKPFSAITEKGAVGGRSHLQDKQINS